MSCGDPRAEGTSRTLPQAMSLFELLKVTRAGGAHASGAYAQFVAVRRQVLMLTGHGPGGLRFEGELENRSWLHASRKDRVSDDRSIERPPTGTSRVSFPLAQRGANVGTFARIGCPMYALEAMSIRTQLLPSAAVGATPKAITRAASMSSFM